MSDKRQQSKRIVAWFSGGITSAVTCKLCIDKYGGAICSSELKRTVRQRFQRDNEFDGQAFGFDYTKRELNRAKALELNYLESKPIFPLIEEKYTKEDCIRKIKQAGIDLPLTYIYGFHNNNCFRTGCVQEGIGYWQKMKREFPEKFEYMARIEHDLTNRKGKPVTMLRDQKTKKHIFLRPHFNYPDEMDISMKKGKEPKPLNDLTKRNAT